MNTGGSGTNCGLTPLSTGRLTAPLTSNVRPHVQAISRRAALTLLTCGAVALPVRAEPMRAVEGEAIAAFLNSLNPPPSDKILLFSSATATTQAAFVGSKPDAKQLASDLPQATNAVIADFLRVADSSSALSIPRHLVRPELRWRVAPKESIDRVFDTGTLSDAWSQFYKQFPSSSGLAQVSRVGVDERSTQALFHISMTYSGLGGTAYFVLLHRTLGIWHVLNTSLAWKS